MRNAKSPAAPHLSQSPSSRRFLYSSILAVTHAPSGHRADRSLLRSYRQMSMKCQAAVERSSSLNSVSGRTDAVAIAFSTEATSEAVPNIFATCSRALADKLSAAMTEMISCPWALQAQAMESGLSPRRQKATAHRGTNFVKLNCRCVSSRSYFSLLRRQPRPGGKGG